ncbi:MAG: SRPBCC family protein [Ilumatobacteraceae bacterium]
MTVTAVDKNVDDLTMTIKAEFDAPVERVWEVLADPRQLERWWGPPSYPATVVDHDLAPGGRVTYFMRGPDGAKYHGWWTIMAVESPRLLDLEDGFAGDDGEPDDSMPTTTVAVRISASSSNVTTMSITTTFRSIDDMEKLIAMGHEEGMTLALGQIDAILTDQETP